MDVGYAILVAAVLLSIVQAVCATRGDRRFKAWVDLHKRRFALDFRLEDVLEQRTRDMAERETLMLAEDRRRQLRSEAAEAANPAFFQDLGKHDAHTSLENAAYQAQRDARATEKRAAQPASLPATTEP